MQAEPKRVPLWLQLRVEAGPTGAWLTVHLAGEMDMATAPALIDEVGKLIEVKDQAPIALETSHVTFCDSSGLNALIRLWKRARSAGVELVILRPHARLGRLLSMTGVDRHLRVLEALPVPESPEPTAVHPPASAGGLSG
jgi:anti-sigma B factor antagonist